MYFVEASTAIRRAFAILAILAGMGCGPEARADDAVLAHAREFLRRYPLIDGHNDLPAVIRESGQPPRDVAAFDLKRRAAGDTDIGRLREGGVGGQFWSVWIRASRRTARAASRPCSASREATRSRIRWARCAITTGSACWSICRTYRPTR